LENAYELGEAGRNDEAKKAYQQAARQAEQMQANLDPGSQEQIDARGALVGCLNDYATFLLKRGELKTAATQLLNARKILEELRRQTSDETKYATSLGQNHYNMGVVCTKAGRHGDAEYSYSQALPLLELTVRTDPEKLVWRQMLAMCQYNLGHLLYVYNNADRYDESRIHLEKSLGEWQRLASSDPFVSEYHSRVGATLNNLGVLATERGDLTEARKLFEEALVNQKRAVAQQPIFELTHQFMGQHYRELTAVLDKLGDAEALAAIQKEQTQWQSSVNSNPAN
jgi:tetratricopeptide (TPR) repeat protein